MVFAEVVDEVIVKRNYLLNFKDMHGKVLVGVYYEISSMLRRNKFPRKWSYAHGLRPLLCYTLQRG